MATKTEYTVHERKKGFFGVNSPDASFLQEVFGGDKGKGEIFILDDELVLGDPDSLISQSTSISDALENPDTIRIPLSEITNVWVKSDTTIGHATIFVDSDTIEDDRVAFFKFGTRSKTAGRDVDEHRDFAETLREAARNAGAELKNGDSEEVPETAETEHPLLMIFLGCFFLLGSVVALLVGRFIAAILGLIGAGACILSGIRRWRS